jgi:hypothetical protein
VCELSCISILRSHHIQATLLNLSLHQQQTFWVHFNAHKIVLCRKRSARIGTTHLPVVCCVQKYPDLAWAERQIVYMDILIKNEHNTNHEDLMCVYSQFLLPYVIRAT